MRHPEIWGSFRDLKKLQGMSQPPEPIDRSGEIPLSFPQERLWMLAQLDPAGAQFNIPYAFRVQGALDLGALSAALKEIGQRHEILRTIFSTKAGKPVQRILPESVLSLDFLDLSEVDPESVEVRAAQAVDDYAKVPFDLAEGPLLRAQAIKLAADEHIFLLTFHHIVYDAWSDGVFFKELDQFYEIFANGKPSSVVALDLQYGDFSVWQRSWIDTEAPELMLDFWREQLRDIEHQHFPTDYPRPLRRSGHLGRSTVVVDESLHQQVKSLANAEGMTDFILFLSAFSLLLSTYLEKNDVYLCSPIATRNRKEVQKMIGYFVNLVIYRTGMSASMTFRELMARVCTVSSGVYANQEMPIQELLNRLDLTNLPLARVMFSVQNASRHTPTLGGLSVLTMEEQRGVDFDIFFEIEDVDEGLTLNLRYSSDLYASDTMDDMLKDYLHILGSVVENADKTLPTILELEPDRREAWRARCAEELLRLERRDDSGEELVPPRDELEHQLVEIWQEILERDRIGIHDNFFQIGGKSLNALEMVVHIESVIGKELPVSALAEAQTIEQIATLLRLDNFSPSSSIAVCLQSQGTKSPLFLLQPAASTPLHFADLARHLAPEQPAYGFEQLGMDPLTDPHRSVEEMAAFYVREMRTVQPEGPYFMIGRCMGGIVAYEMAVQLQSEGEEIAFLGILDTQSPPRLTPRDAKYYISEAVKRLIHYTLNGELFSATIGRYWKKSKRRSSGDESERRIQHVMDTHARARKRYIPAKLFNGVLWIFKNNEASLDAQAGWEALATGGLKYLETSGSHETMLEEPFVHEFVSKLTEVIDDCIKSRAGSGDKAEAA